MSTLPEMGTPAFPEIMSPIPASSQEQLETALHELNQNKNRWIQTAVPERIAILDEILHDLAAVLDQWVAVSLQAKGLAAGSAAEADEWSGCAAVFRMVNLYRRALSDIQRTGYPQIPGTVTTRPDGQVVARVFPQSSIEKAVFMGISGEVWMMPEVTQETLHETQAGIYRDKLRGIYQPGKIALVLAAGNFASLGPTDTLHKLFSEDQVVIMKTSPVNAYLGAIWEDAFKALISRGFLRIVHGGVETGQYLVHHPLVDELHLTGSDKTFEAIVFGQGETGRNNKHQRTPIVTKRFTAELGTVSPLIIVPGPWSDKDLRYQASNVATMLATNAGFICMTPRVIIQHTGWPQREKFLNALRAVLSKVETRRAYYPGASERYRSFLDAHPEAEQYGSMQDDALPWTLIPNVNPDNQDEISFNTEPFCSVFSETSLDAASVPEYLEKVVAFANERLWGSLCATILVHPKSLKDPVIAAAVEKAIADLRYGTVGVNIWGAYGLFFGTTTWGGYPGHDIYDIQSGTGIMANTLMFSRPQKSVVRGPFRMILDLVSVENPNVYKFAREYALYQYQPSLRQVMKMMWAGLRG